MANPKQLHGLFGDDVRDILVNNGSDAHHGERYLTAVETGRAVAEGLRVDSSEPAHFHWNGDVEV